jgi:hypothetical protein
MHGKFVKKRTKSRKTNEGETKRKILVSEEQESSRTMTKKNSHGLPVIAQLSDNTAQLAYYRHTKTLRKGKNYTL